MAEENGIYKCEVCGNIVSVIEAHDGTLVCCGQEMKILEEKAIEQEGNEKHVPIIETSEGKVKVSVGSVPHPMEEDHWIELIQLLKDGKVIAEKKLSPGDTPVAEFCVSNTEGISAREICNKHGLWKS